MAPAQELAMEAVKASGIRAAPIQAVVAMAVVAEDKPAQ